MNHDNELFMLRQASVYFQNFVVSRASWEKEINISVYVNASWNIIRKRKQLNMINSLLQQYFRRWFTCKYAKFILFFCFVFVIWQLFTKLDNCTWHVFNFLIDSKHPLGGRTNYLHASSWRARQSSSSSLDMMRAKDFCMLQFDWNDKDHSK